MKINTYMYLLNQANYNYIHLLYGYIHLLYGYTLKFTHIFYSLYFSIWNITPTGVIELVTNIMFFVAFYLIQKLLHITPTGVIILYSMFHQNMLCIMNHLIMVQKYIITVQI